MGPIKINIATKQIEGASEYDAPTSEYDAPATESTDTKVDEAEDKENNGCYSYEGSDCIYTEPASGIKYLWDVQKNQWVNKETGEARDPGPTASSEADLQSQNQSQLNYKFDGKTYYYVDRLSMQKYTWNLETKGWELTGKVEEGDDEESEEDENMTNDERTARQYRKRKAAPWFQPNAEKKIEKDPVTGISTYKDPEDGTVYELDPVKNAWFPKIDEEFMANYQINYGFTKDGVAEPTKPSEETPKPTTAVPAAEKKKKKTDADKEAAWFEEEESKSTKVYVSNLPSDITEESFIEFMSKCGMIEHDIRTKKAKIKIYKTEDGQPKGDGLCSYIKPESVQLALTILDGAELDGKTISVTRAKFEMKGSYDPKLKPKKLTKKQLEKAKKAKERMFEWIPEKLKGERAKHEKTIVIKNMFTVEELDRDPGLILDYSNNIRSQCSKFGSVAKVTLYDKHPDGVCQVFFKDATEADMAVEMLNGRMFGHKIMEVATWDGRTKYKTEETKEDEEERLAQWEKFLKEGDAGDGANKSVCNSTVSAPITTQITSFRMGVSKKKLLTKLRSEGRNTKKELQAQMHSSNFWYVLFNTAALITFYYITSIGLTFYQSWLMKELKFPLTIVLSHFIMKFCLASLCRLVYTMHTGLNRVGLGWAHILGRIGVVALVGSMDIGLSQWSFEYIDVALYTITKSTSIVFILMWAIVFRLEKKHWSLIVIVLMISAGLTMFTYKSTDFVLIGFLMALSASFLSGIRWTLSQLIMQKAQYNLSNPIDMIYHVQPIMIISMLPITLAFEGTRVSTSISMFRFADSATFIHTLSLVSFGGFIAFGMEVAEFLLVSYTSSLTLSVVGIVKEIISLTLAIIFQSSDISIINMVGLVVCMTGISLHVIRKATNVDKDTMPSNAGSPGSHEALLSGSDTSDSETEVYHTSRIYGRLPPGSSPPTDEPFLKGHRQWTTVRDTHILNATKPQSQVDDTPASLSNVGCDVTDDIVDLSAEGIASNNALDEADQLLQQLDLLSSD